MNVGENLRWLLATRSPDQAQPLIVALLEEKLIGCGNVIPGIVSRSGWESDFQRNAEIVLLMETTPERVDPATARLGELHAYAIPEIIVPDPLADDATYVAWLHSLTSGADATEPSRSGGESCGLRGRAPRQEHERQYAEECLEDSRSRIVSTCVGHCENSDGATGSETDKQESEREENSCLGARAQQGQQREQPDGGLQATIHGAHLGGRHARRQRHARLVRHHRRPHQAQEPVADEEQGIQSEKDLRRHRHSSENSIKSSSGSSHHRTPVASDDPSSMMLAAET